MRPNKSKCSEEHVRIDFVPRHTDGECRCKNCKKLLAKIKSVDKFMVIEIKCNRSNCGLINTFEVSRNTEYVNDLDHKKGYPLYTSAD